MTPKKVIIEITSSTVKTSVLAADGDLMGEYTWQRVTNGIWRGQKNDWREILADSEEFDGDFHRLADELDEISLTDIGAALGEVNFEDFE